MFSDKDEYVSDKFLLYVPPSNPLASLDIINVVNSPKHADNCTFCGGFPTKNFTNISLYI